MTGNWTLTIIKKCLFILGEIDALWLCLSIYEWDEMISEICFKTVWEGVSDSIGKSNLAISW